MENSFSPEPSHSGRHDTPSLRQYTADIGSQDDIQNVGGLPPVEQTRNQEDKQDSQVDHFGYESPEMELPDSKDDDNESAVADDEDPYKRVYTPALPRTEETLDQVQYDPPEAEQIERGDVKGELMDELVDTVEESDAANSPRKKRKKKKKKQVKNGVKDGETDGNEEKVMLQRRGESSGSLNVRLTPIGQNTETLQEEDTPSVLPPDSWKKAYDLPVQSDITYGEENKDNGAQSSWYPSVQHITQHYENGRDMSQDQGYSSEVRQRAAEGQRDHHETWGKPDDERQKSLVIGAEDSEDGIGCCGWILYIFSILLILLTLPFSLMFTIKVVQEYERAVIFRLGRLPQGGAKGPGIFFIMPCIENYTKIDLRTVTFDVPPQEVLTKDSVTVSVDAVVYYQVSNPTVSVANVENAHHSTRLLAQTTLRNILGTKDMSEILSDREGISQGMQSTLDNATDRWGIQVERVEIKDVRLPVQLQRAMAAEAEASREARAKVIAAEGEFNASRALRDAAVIMDTSPAALQLRYLQTLNSISAEKNSTIIFPVPINLLAKKQS